MQKKVTVCVSNLLSFSVSIAQIVLLYMVHPMWILNCQFYVHLNCQAFVTSITWIIIYYFKKNMDLHPVYVSLMVHN